MCCNENKEKTLNWFIHFLSICDVNDCSIYVSWELVSALNVQIAVEKGVELIPIFFPWTNSLSAILLLRFFAYYFSDCSCISCSNLAFIYLFIFLPFKKKREIEIESPILSLFVLLIVLVTLMSRLTEQTNCGWWLYEKLGFGGWL